MNTLIAPKETIDPIRIKFDCEGPLSIKAIKDSLEGLETLLNYSKEVAFKSFNGKDISLQLIEVKKIQEGSIILDIGMALLQGGRDVLTDEAVQFWGGLIINALSTYGNIVSLYNKNQKDVEIQQEPNQNQPVSVNSQGGSFINTGTIINNGIMHIWPSQEMVQSHIEENTDLSTEQAKTLAEDALKTFKNNSTKRKSICNAVGKMVHAGGKDIKKISIIPPGDLKKSEDEAEEKKRSIDFVAPENIQYIPAKYEEPEVQEGAEKHEYVLVKITNYEDKKLGKRWEISIQPENELDISTKSRTLEIYNEELQNQLSTHSFGGLLRIDLIANYCINQKGIRDYQDYVLTRIH